MNKQQASTVHCPQCSFTIFNRRYPKCEHCGAKLPTELLLHHPEKRRIVENEIAAQALVNRPARNRRAAPSRSRRPTATPAPAAASEA